MHSGLLEYAASKTTPVRASRSMVGRLHHRVAVTAQGDGCDLVEHDHQDVGAGLGAAGSLRALPECDTPQVSGATDDRVSRALVATVTERVHGAAVCSRRANPDARCTLRETAARTASSVPIMVTFCRARVTAV